MRSNNGWKMGEFAIGQPVPRFEDPRLVKGGGRYVADMMFPGTVFGYVLRSPHAHARIRSIDTSKAKALPGVLAVVTAEDLPESGDRMVDLGEGNTRLRYIHGNVLAQGKVLYKGHAVAGVAAASAHVAEEAAGLIEVDYE